MNNINLILEKIGLAPAERNVYVALLEGATSVKEIMKITAEKRPTIYYSLNSLEALGLVSKTGKEYGNKFQVEPVEKLVSIVDQNIEKHNKLKRDILDITQFYCAKEPGYKTLVSYYDDAKAIELAITYTLYCKNKKIKTIVPKKNYFTALDNDFRKEYVEEKKQRGIVTRAVWEDIPNEEVISKYYDKSEVRELPVNMRNNFQTTVFMYDDKTLYISPEKENYAVLIQSQEHSMLMNAIFENIWASAKPIK